MLFSIETKVFICIGIAFLIFVCASLLIGEQRKALWFRKRTKYSFFLRRSFVGEFVHFGYPVTKEGYAVTSLIFATIGIACYIVNLL